MNPSAGALRHSTQQSNVWAELAATPDMRGYMDRDILIEIVRVGDSVKLTAIDAETGVEAVVLGPAHASRADLEKLAVNKLQRMLDKRGDNDRPTRRGFVV